MGKDQCLLPHLRPGSLNSQEVPFTPTSSKTSSRASPSAEAWLSWPTPRPGERAHLGVPKPPVPAEVLPWSTLLRAMGTWGQTGQGFHRVPPGAPAGPAPSPDSKLVLPPPPVHPRI